MDRYSNEEKISRNEDLPTRENPPVKSMNKKPKKKKKVFRKIIIAILLILLAFSGYSYASYRKGLKSATNDKTIQKVKVDTFNGEKSSDGAINILLLGSDSRGEDQGRSDTIMVAHYDKDSKTPKLLSFMRDTYVNIPGVGYNKLNAAYSYGGPELVRKTLKEMFGISIQYYAVVNFESFPKIIDTLLPKGVSINAEKDLDLDGVYIKKGQQKMNGKQILQYSRFRHDAESDFGRVRRQQQVMTAVMSQAASVTSIFTLPETIGKVQGYTSTDIPNSVYVTIGKDILLGQAKSLQKFSIPADGTWSNGNYDGIGSVLEIDEAANKAAVLKFLND